MKDKNYNKPKIIINRVYTKKGDKGKTIQIIFRKKNNQRQTSSTTKSNIRGSSMHRPQGSSNLMPSNQFRSKGSKNFNCVFIQMNLGSSRAIRQL